LRVALSALLVAAACLSTATVSAAPAGGETPKPKPVRMTAFYIPGPGVDAKTVARVSRRIGKALRRDRRLTVKDSDKLLAEFAGDVPSNELNAAKQSQQEGIKLLAEDQPKLAAAKLAEAIQQYEGILAFVKKRRLANCMMALAVAHARARQRRKATSTFRRLLIWRPRVRFPTALYGAKLIPLFERARRKVKRLRRGSVELKTEPAGAKAYVDGRFAGITPTTAFGLVAGQHYATFKKPGFIKGAQKVLVSGRKQGSYEVKLDRSQKFLLLKQTLRKASSDLGQPRANPSMLDLRSVLFVDQVLFATVKAVGQSQLTIRTYLYDLRSKRLLNKAKLTMARKQIDKLDELARLTYLNVRIDGTLAAPPEAPPPPPKKRRAFYATWWFWTAVGAAAAAVVLPVVLWPEADKCPGGNRCIGFAN
jgi:hypothetical protein